ncbi:MAG TPA: AI-2E family transporter [Candidatus Paceibacterota bacterium]|nr:AI-2E family transporter [Candidatus Paceibacterota bacterium]
MRTPFGAERIEITTGTIAKGILLVIAAWAVFALKDIILVVLTAVVIASAVEPGILWFIKRRIPRVFAAIITYAAIGALLVGAFYTIVPKLLQDTSEFLNSVPQYIDSASLWNPLGEEKTEASKKTAVSISQGIQTIAQKRLLTTATQNTSTAAGVASVQGAIQSIDEAINSVSAGFVHSASSVFGGVLAFILIVVLSFYLAVQEDGVEKFLRVVIPDAEESYVIRLWRKVKIKIGLWMQGQVVLALLVGLLVYLGLMVLGVKNALLFAALAALLETIPLFGPIIAAVPAVAASYNDGGTTAALIVAALYLVIHQFENHLIYPLVVKKIVGVPPILVILSLLVGYKLAGFLGIILSVPAASMLIEFIDDMEKRRKVAA